MDHKINIIVPVYNAEQWISKNLESILSQTYSNWSAIVINDASTDSTGDIISDMVGGDNRFVIVNRDVNVGPLANLVYGTNTLCTDDEDIIITVDGDDWLENENVLSYINNVYNDDGVLVTPWIVTGKLN